MPSRPEKPDSRDRQDSPGSSRDFFVDGAPRVVSDLPLPPAPADSDAVGGAQEVIMTATRCVLARSMACSPRRGSSRPVKALSLPIREPRACWLSCAWAAIRTPHMLRAAVNAAPR